MAASFSAPVTVGSTTLTPVGAVNTYVAKYNAAGTLQWLQQLTGNVSFEQLKLDALGNLILMTRYVQAAHLGSLAVSTPAQSGHLLARLDAQGAPLSLWPIGEAILSSSPSGAITLTNINNDAAGNVYFHGTFRGQVLIGTTTLNGSLTTGLDQFIGKVNLQGSLEWVRQGGSMSGTAGYDVQNARTAVAPGGDLYFIWAAAPNVGNFGTVVAPTGVSDNSILVVKYNPQGTVLWAKRFSSFAGSVLAGEGVVLSSGQLALVGDFANDITLGTQRFTPGHRCGVVFLLDPATGSVLMATILDGNLEKGYGLTADGSNNLYVVGGAYPGSTGVYAASCTVAGITRWVKRTTSVTGSNSFGAGYGAALAGNDLMVSGNILNGSALQFGPDVITGAADFRARLGGVVTATRPAAVAALALFPNPAATGTTVTLPAFPAGTELTLTDALGRVARRQSAGPGLALTGLAPGLYVVQATSAAGERWSSRLVVE